MTQKDIEKRALIISSVVNFIIAGAGLWVFLATHIQALFLDCFFSVIALVSSILATVISKASKRRTKSYPDGIYFLEPLYGILKSLLTLALLVISVVATSTAAYEYFALGKGSLMNIGPVLPYTIAMVILCFGLSIFNARQNKRINNTSTILTAEAKSNFIDGLQSLGIGVAIALLYLVDVNGPLGFLHYTGDFFITVILALMSLKQPIKVLFNSFVELSNGTTTDKEIKGRITKSVNAHLDTVVQHKKCDIYKVGMHIKIQISISENVDASTLLALKNARRNIVDDLRKTYEGIELVYAY